MGQPLSRDLDDPDARPYFLWSEDITMKELRAKLGSADLDERALWMGRVMREARYQDVFELLRLCDVLPLLPRIDRHLGRAREFWHWLSKDGAAMASCLGIPSYGAARNPRWWTW